jgi:Tfp pilus assembly protein PilX
MNNKFRNGQVGLLLLVIMGVVVALVMSVASRSLSDTVLSRQERESSAAFSVAETGVENALNALRQGNVQEGVVTLPTSLGLVTGQYEVTSTTTYGLYVSEGESAHLDLSSYVPTLTISWTRIADNAENITTCSEGSGLSPAAIEVSALSATTVNRVYYNPAGCNPGSNGFTGSISGGSEYRSMVASYAVPVGTTMIRIKPIYAGATISVTGSGLTDQLYLIQSRATGGDARKEIEVKRGLDAPPSIFDYAVFTAGTIVK